VIGWTWSSPVLDRLKRLSVKIGLAKTIASNRRLLRLSSKVVQDKYVPSVKGRIPTIFDYAQNPIDIDVPCYSPDAYEEERHHLTDGLGNPIKERKIAENAWKTFREKRRKVLKMMDEEWDLLMAHFYLPDIIQHVSWYRNEQIQRLYEEIDETACVINKRLGEDIFTLFMSDHGQEKGLHTPNAFYSCNQKIGLHNPRMTDFADVIRKKLGAPSRDDVSRVKKRLQELGYF